VRELTKTKQPTSKTLDLDQLIRAETVLSRLPIHNLERSNEDDFRIMIRRKKNDRQIESERHADKALKLTAREKQNNKLKQYHFYWKVSPNAHYGWPSKLSYDFETLFLAKLIDGIGRPLPRILRIGSLSNITRVLGLKNTSTSHIKQAILQSAFTGIDFRVNVKGIDEKVTPIEGHGTRFNIIVRGETMADGSKADTFYLSFNDPFLHIYNNAKVAPRDYKYMASLKPLQRRFYEIIQPQLYGTHLRREEYLDVDYSWYCTHAPVRRHKDRKLMQTQMGRIQKPHIQAGYIDRVEYFPTTDMDGKTWTIRYYPGPAASEEHRVFEGLKLPDRYRTSARTKKVLQPQKHLKAVPEAQNEPKSAPSDPIATVVLTRYFELIPTATSNPKDHRLALELVQNYCTGDQGVALSVIEYFARRLEELNWKDVQTFNALFSNDARYIKEALETLEQHELELEDQKKRDKQTVIQQREHEAYELWVKGKIETYQQTDEYQELLAQQRDNYRKRFPGWTEEIAEKTARYQVRNDLMKKSLSRKRWQQETAS